MTVFQWDRVAGVMLGLWPVKFRDMTDEQAGTWKRVCAGHSPDDCIRELRAIAEISVYAPKPADLRRRLMRSRDSAGVVEKKAQSPEDVFRIAHAHGSRRPEWWLNLTDEEARALQAYHEYSGHLRVYGRTEWVEVLRLRFEDVRHDMPEGWE